MKPSNIIILLLVAVIYPSIVSAYSFEVDGIYYGGISSAPGGIDVTYQSTDGEFFYGNYTGDVIIPESVTYNGTTYSVTGIGFRAFNWSSLNSITIPKSMRNIEAYAFDLCSIKRVNITDLVAWCNIYFGHPGDAWNEICYENPLSGAHLFLNGEEVKDLVIPGTITSIPCYAFYGGIGLTSVAFPNSVTNIGGGAFDRCDSLISVSIGSSVNRIGCGAFYNCNALSKIICLASVPPTIESFPFYNDAFSDNVYNQATLYVPMASVSAYQEADNWKNFYRIVGIPFIDDFEVDGIYYHALSENTVMVIQKPEDEQYYQGNIVISDSIIYNDMRFMVTSIGDSAFEDCYELNSVVIGNKVERIGEEAFQGCTGLTNITIGSGVTNIGTKAFNYCNALQTVTCQGTVPPVMESSNCFSTAAYTKAVLKVPRQEIEAYSTADYWHKFLNIEGFGSAGPGDINADGIVSITDVTVLINILLAPSSEYDVNADLNHNGIIDIGDVTSLIVILLTGNHSSL